MENSRKNLKLKTEPFSHFSLSSWMEWKTLTLKPGIGRGGGGGLFIGWPGTPGNGPVYPGPGTFCCGGGLPPPGDGLKTDPIRSSRLPPCGGLSARMTETDVARMHANTTKRCIFVFPGMIYFIYMTMKLIYWSSAHNFSTTKYKYIFKFIYMRCDAPLFYRYVCAIVSW